MKKLVELVADGELRVEELSRLPELIERAKLVLQAMEACRKTICFPLGVQELKCYEFEQFGEYHAWGLVSPDGYFTCWSNWGGDHRIGWVSLNNAASLFLALEDPDFAPDLTRFLKEQIEKVTWID